MNAVLQDILNFLLPPRCMCCGKIMFDDNGVCPECFNQITFISAPYCAHCGCAPLVCKKRNLFFVCSARR